METIDISLPGMLAIYALFLIPLAIIALFKLGLVRESLLALARMTVQLLFVGVYLEFIFELNSWAVNLAWVAIMLLTANCAILSRAHLSKREMFPVTFTGLAFATAAVAGFFAVGVLGASPRNARYLIPILGMILGNCMRGNVIALERFFSGIRENEMEFITYQLLGATPLEAARPYLRRALKAAVSPYISTMATIGIVSLPGMLTGQILGGSLPLTAIKYQIAIMVCIFSSVVLAAALNLLASTRIAFDQWGMLRGEVFAK